MKNLLTAALGGAILFGAAALGVPASAAAAGLKCECVNCRLEKGREQQDFYYNPKDRTGYDLQEQQAMAEADQKAADAANDAAQKYLGMMCPAPCGAPGITVKHGKPFAGGTEGRGIARSRWEVDYTCKKNLSPVNLPGQVYPNPPPPPPPPTDQPVNTAPGGSGGGGGGPLQPNIELPKIPACFGLPVDKDDMIAELRRLRAQAQTNLPLGAAKDDPEFDRAWAQSKVNVKAIDDAIDQVEKTPYCPLEKHHSSFWDHFSIGIGVGVGGGGGDRHHDDHHDQPREQPNPEGTPQHD